MKAFTHIAILIFAAGVLAGCASTDENRASLNDGDRIEPSYDYPCLVCHGRANPISDDYSHNLYDEAKVREAREAIQQRRLREPEPVPTLKIILIIQ